ncbi:L,D-transpeptidase [Acidithiobacillus ferrivorans]|uniref:L,D-transpeptidase n=1 Tax=Acidithiobacillus ferrivorans TaxID=160808 RepID=UPI0012E07095|nr:L,D-transpeptidase [Acidithiobacillus ferrivorans]
MLSDLGYLPQPGQHRPPALIRAMREHPSAFIRGASVQLTAAQKLDCFAGAEQSECLPADPWPFTWVQVDKHAGTVAPETVTVWGMDPVTGMGNERFHIVYRTQANTGVLHSTPDGSWPIYQRYRVTTMQGAFPVPLPAVALLAISMSNPKPGGAEKVSFWHGAWVRWKPYDDRDIKWVSYFDGGRALHFFPRARYGFPQSAGCVEMPLSAAHMVYCLTRMGTVVTVAAGRAVMSGRPAGLAKVQDGSRA